VLSMFSDVLLDAGTCSDIAVVVVIICMHTYRGSTFDMWLCFMICAPCYIEGE
jgi:hypothetical protein